MGIELSEFLNWYEHDIKSQRHIIDLVEGDIQKWRECESSAPFAAQRVEGLLKGDKAEKYKERLIKELKEEENRECVLAYIYEYPEEKGFKLEGDRLIETYKPSYSLCTTARMKASEIKTARFPEHDGKKPSRIMVDSFF